MNIQEAMCATCGFETFVSDQDTMEGFHREFDGAHEPYWYVNDEPLAFDEIHILSATGVILADGIQRNLTHCHAAFRYRGGVSDEFVIGNYYGERGATCRPCIAAFKPH